MLETITAMLPMTGAATAPVAGVSQGKTQDFINLLLGKTGSAHGTDLAAKIAEALKNNPHAAAGLQKVLDQLGIDLTTTGLQSTLTSDLAAQLAATLQQVDGASLAAALNGIEPGATEPALTPEILQQIEQMIAGEGLLNADKLAVLTEKISAFLQKQGFDRIEIGRLIQDMTTSGRLTLEGNAIELANLEALYNAPIVKKQPAIQMAAVSPETVVAQAVTAPQAKPAAPVSALAMIQAMNNGNSSSGNFTDSGFNQQGHGSFQQNTLSYDAQGVLKAGNDMSAQNFVNYMTAAKTGHSPTTQMVAMQITRNAGAKIDTFTMQLDPADLGRMDVRLSFERDGGMKAHMTVEKPETLALLQRDAQQLERILQQSGLDLDENALSFDLQHQGHQQHAHADEREAATENGFDRYLGGNNDDIETIAAKIAVNAPGYISQSGVNIMV